MMAEPVNGPLRQINLYNASLIPTREIFSARLIVAWILLAAFAMAAIAWWAVIETRKIGVEIANQASRQTFERARKAAVLTSGEVLPTPEQLFAREQAMRSQQTLLDTRRALRDQLKRGIAGDSAGPSALMRLIANTIPPQAWVTEVRVAGSQIDVIGRTLDPAAVDVWLKRLRASTHFAAKPLPAVRLERLDAPAPAPAHALTVYSFAISAALSAPFAEERERP